MALDQARRVSPNIIQADEEALIAVQNMPTYAPANPAYAMATLASHLDALEAARTAEINAQNALKAARDALTAAEWTFHNAMLGTKDQVVAQYSADSDEVAAMGLKKKSQHKRPGRRQTEPVVL